MTTHELKILPAYFEAWMAGRKRAEFRNADRNFRVGDTVKMWEWNKKYTGRFIMAEILHIDDVQDIIGLHGASISSIAVYQGKKSPKSFIEMEFCILSLATRQVGKGTPPKDPVKKS
jgi:hypothetical protein